MRIFYPAFDKTELLGRLRERLGRLESKLPLVRVVLFGSYARLEPHLYTEAEYAASRATVDRMVRDGVTLLG